MHSALALPPLLTAIERRRSSRSPLGGVAELHLVTTDWYGPGALIDIGEGGLCLSLSVAPCLGELVRIDIGGLVSEGRVRNVAREDSARGTRYRVGVELQ